MKLMVSKCPPLTLFRVAISAKEANDVLGRLPERWDYATDDNRLNMLAENDR